ncbi:alpha/beta fold hydrolase [Paracidovorax konjaci]|uniref:Alpha/beta hydrolase fold n=1 Tax=Paracidovorax konjaci TaxID=32040 RepID=A0A1I1UQK1_9BURK|nr:alpha/beta fold hydrolase [Paracidovorax konjaci]SFD71938.1 alpha/beta hydrolase fold [Paracidovorax konjaci]
MPTLALGAQIHWEDYGPAASANTGLPVLLLAPGGLRSRIGLWRHTHDGRARDWPDPTVELARDRRVIAVDQRNAGLSVAPVGPHDGWDTFAADHLGVLDALGIDRFHVLGACIGASFALRLVERAPHRVASAVLQQPIGWTPRNAPLRRENFQAWVDSAGGRLAGVPAAHLHALEHNLFGNEDFVFSVSRDFVRGISAPLLVLAGNDIHHPLEVSRELAALAPRAQIIEDWRGEQHRSAYLRGVRGFLASAELPPRGQA